MANAEAVVVEKPVLDGLEIHRPCILGWFQLISCSKAGMAMSDFKIRFHGLPDVEIPTHKVVLATVIPFFDNMAPLLMEEDSCEGFLELDPSIVSPESFRMILDYVNGARIRIPAVNQAEIKTACEFLMFDCLTENLERSLSGSQSPFTLRGISEYGNSAQCHRMNDNLAQMYASGALCDLTIKFYGAGCAESPPTFRVHKCLVATLFSKFLTLFPNLRELSEVELCASQIQPVMFERLLEHVYGTKELGKLSDVDDVFGLIQACDYLGFDRLFRFLTNVQLTSPLEETDCMNELDWCFQLYRYARDLKQNSGWAYPADVVCRALTLAKFINEVHGNAPYDFKEVKSARTLPFSALEALVSTFRPESLIQTELLAFVGAWFLWKPVERMKDVETLLKSIDLGAIDLGARIEEVDGLMKCFPGLKSKIIKRAPWIHGLMRTLRSDGIELKTGDKFLQNRVLCRVAGENMCVAPTPSHTVVGFSSTGQLEFQNSKILSFRSFKLLKLVSFSGRLFLISRQYRPGGKTIKHGDLLNVWEWIGGQISGQFRLTWLQDNLPEQGPESDSTLHIVSDHKRLLHVVECERVGDDVFMIRGCSYDLCGVDSTKYAVGANASMEPVPFESSFEGAKFDIQEDMLDFIRSPPDPLITATDGHLIFMFAACVNISRGIDPIFKYDVHTYSVKNGIWGVLPSLEHVNDELPLQLVTHGASLYVGFLLGSTHCGVAVDNIIGNGPKFHIRSLKPDSDRWTPIVASDILGGWPCQPELYCIGHRLFLTGWDRWGGVRVTKSLDLRDEATDGWESHPELAGYHHPEHFCSVEKPEAKGSASGSSHANGDGNVLRHRLALPYAKMVMEAVRGLKEKGGSSADAVSNYIRSNFDPDAHRVGLSVRRELAKRVEEDHLVTVEKAQVTYYRVKICSGKCKRKGAV